MMGPCPAVATGEAPSAVDEGGADGLWWGFSVSAAGVRLTCDLCETPRELGPAISASVGAYANPTLRVGLEAGWWTHEDGDVRESIYRGGLVAQLHPRPGSGLHLVAGAGWSGYRAGDFSYDAARLTLGAGWDLPLTRSWVVGNTVSLDAASFGALENDGAVVVRSVGLSLVRIGVHVRHR